MSKETIKEKFIRVYPTLTESDCWDGQNIFETALHQCGFFEAEHDEDLYDTLFDLTK